MSKCDLRVVLDDPERNYEPGETVTGHVEVDVSAECWCNKLTVELRWFSRGRGNKTKGPIEYDEVLFEGRWLPGEQLRYEFKFALPLGPLTYHGTNVSRDWILKARADIPWAIDPKADCEVLVARGRFTGEISSGSDPNVVKSRALGSNIFSSKLGLTCISLFMLPFILGGLGAIAIGIFGSHDGQPFAAAFLIFFGILFGGIPLATLLFLARSRFAATKFSEISISSKTPAVRAGENVRAVLTMTPRDDLEINLVKIILRGREVAISGSGTRRTTHTHVVHEDVHEVLLGERLSSGQDYSEVVDFVLPSDAPPTFVVRDNALTWSVSAQVDIPQWTDWSGEEEIEVLP